MNPIIELSLEMAPVVVGSLAAIKQKIRKTMKTPKIKTPKIKTPKIKTPKIKTPKMKTMKMKTVFSMLKMVLRLRQDHLVGLYQVVFQ